MTWDDGMDRATLHLPTREQAIEQYHQALRDSARPCPFCGGTDLVVGSLFLDNDADAEVLSIECKNCYGAAPYHSWQRRQGG